VARYTGPQVKISRRLGVNVFENEKGERGVERKPYPPGEHGRGRRRQPSEYSLQLAEKQKAKYIYGVLEKQFVNLYKVAHRSSGITGENLLRMLEQRIDNVVFRSGFARTRPQARQLVNHGHVTVNGERVTIPSFRVRKGDVVEISPKARKMIIVQHNVDTLDRIPPMWLDVAKTDFKAVVRDLPLREQIDVPVREQLIVELYSK
jgi:small subunit ribosomal protein S4